MTASYILRLLLLCLASFFLVHLALGTVVSLLSRSAVRLAERIEPHMAARFLLALRLFPASFALLIVAAILAPSYLWLEPRATAEPIGLACLAAATLGLALWGFSIARTLGAASRSLRHLHRCQELGSPTHLTGETLPVWVIEDEAPVVMLAGVLRSRMVISRKVVTALAPEQLATVLQHERAHDRSHDNLKRLFVLLAPGILPFVRGFTALERGWNRVAEWSADDRAVAGDSQQSLTLAAALVRVARLGTAVTPPPLATSLMASGVDLSTRVDRLLAAPPDSDARGRRARLVLTACTLVLCGSLAAVIVQPYTFHAAHEFLEALIR